MQGREREGGGGEKARSCPGVVTLYGWSKMRRQRMTGLGAVYDAFVILADAPNARDVLCYSGVYFRRGDPAVCGVSRAH